jgi:hypothetical protein
MIHLIPYLIVIVAYFIHSDNTNRAVAGLVIMFYSVTWPLHEYMVDDPIIFKIDIAMRALFYVCLMPLLKRVTLMIKLLCVTDLLLTVLDLTASFAYTYSVSFVYETIGKLSEILIILQWSALWVRDARSAGASNTRSLGYWVGRTGDSARYMLYH